MTWLVWPPKSSWAEGGERRMTIIGLHSFLPVALVVWPLLAAGLVGLLGQWRRGIRDGVMVGAVTMSLLGVGVLAHQTSQHGMVGAAIPALLGNLSFVADSFSVLFALFTTLVWVTATLYSLAYLKDHEGAGRFHVVSLILLSAVLGVVLAGDLITLFLFFELLGLGAFVLVIFSGTLSARRAGVKYVLMMVLAGLFLLAGILLSYGLGGDGTLAPLPHDAGGEGLRWTAALLMVLGFSVKAGVVPVHTWLPHAHAAAPSPASALLSGVMIKAGAYGIFRTLSALFRPEEAPGAAAVEWAFSMELGLGVLWLGIATMGVGVVLALAQNNAKRLLAYSSVSQMGFILTGLGAGAFLASQGAMGTGGGLMHVANHALFKSCLFLGVGAVLFRTGHAELDRLGGLWRRMPATFFFMLVAGAGIAGVPFFNGFVSKGLIHHALETGMGEGGMRSLAIAEILFMATSAGTVAVVLKLMVGTFLGPEPEEGGPRIREAPWAMLLPMGLLSATILLLGLRPHLFLHGLVAPGLHSWGLPASDLQYYLDSHYLSRPEILTATGTLILGTLLFAASRRWNLLPFQWPAWLGVDAWYRAGAQAGIEAFRWVADSYETVRRLPAQTLVRRARAIPPPEWVAGQPFLDWIWSGIPADIPGTATRVRRRIRRYTREMTGNLALIFVLLLAFLAALAAGILL